MAEREFEASRNMGALMIGAERRKRGSVRGGREAADPARVGGEADLQKRRAGRFAIVRGKLAVEVPHAAQSIFAMAHGFGERFLSPPHILDEGRALPLEIDGNDVHEMACHRLAAWRA